MNRKGRPYEPGELELVLSLTPTRPHIKYLAQVLSRTEGAIEIAYRLAYGRGPFGKDATSQRRKIAAAKRRVGLVL